MPVETAAIPLQVEGTEPLRVWVLSDLVEGVIVHYNGLRTLPCTEGVDEDGEIHACWHKHARPEDSRWQGWLCACRLNHVECRLLCVTPSVVATCRGLNFRKDLRGFRLDVKRVRNHPQARMVGRYWQEPTTPQLPAAVNVRVTLEKMWDAPLRKVSLRQASRDGTLDQGSPEGMIPL